VDNEQALDMTEEEFPQNIANSEVDEDGETDESLFVQDVRLHILAEVGGTQDDDQPASQEDNTAIVGNETIVEDEPTSSTNSIDKGMIMPTFRIR
jgi:hypothetical protein